MRALTGSWNSLYWYSLRLNIGCSGLVLGTCSIGADFGSRNGEVDVLLVSVPVWTLREKRPERTFELREVGEGLMFARNMVNLFFQNGLRVEIQRKTVKMCNNISFAISP